MYREFFGLHLREWEQEGIINYIDNLIHRKKALSP